MTIISSFLSKGTICIKQACDNSSFCSCFSLCRSKVQDLCYAPHAKKLISCSEDGIVRVWDMNVKRQEASLSFVGKDLVS